MYHQKCIWSTLKESGTKLLTMFCTLTTITWVNICKTNYTYMSLMDLNLILCIQFILNLSGVEVEVEILATICHLLYNSQNSLFWGGVAFPYIYYSGDYIWNYCQTMRKEEAIGQFCTKCPVSRCYICPTMDEPWNITLPNGCHFIPIYS